jgi:hypothetical protein
MAVLLLDDRDGRVIAEIESEEDAQRVLEAWARPDGSIPAYLSVVVLRSHHGPILGTTLPSRSARCGKTRRSRTLLSLARVASARVAPRHR